MALLECGCRQEGAWKSPAHTAHTVLQLLWLWGWKESPGAAQHWERSSPELERNEWEAWWNAISSGLCHMYRRFITARITKGPDMTSHHRDSVEGSRASSVPGCSFAWPGGKHYRILAVVWKLPRYSGLAAFKRQTGWSQYWGIKAHFWFLYSSHTS